MHSLGRQVGRVSATTAEAAPECRASMSRPDPNPTSGSTSLVFCGPAETKLVSRDLSKWQIPDLFGCLPQVADQHDCYERVPTAVDPAGP